MRLCAAAGKGVRFDTDNGKDWEAAWAFPLKEGADKREKGYAVSVKGNFTISTDYPHCPHCGNPSFFLCGTCGKLTCWDGITKRVVYANCGYENVLTSRVTEIRGDGNF